MYCLNSTGPITPALMDYDGEFTLILHFDFDEE
jgi:hypothetical protein